MREKDQTFCPKCHLMYCEGYWGEGVCIADMRFSSDPTSRGDDIADYVRQWYELNRETWLDRHQIPFGYVPDKSGVHADEFMLQFLSEVRRVNAEADRQTGKAA
jgi:hypothetical protein